jgi:hypothetical protein
MFFAPGLVFCGTKGVGSCYHVLCAPDSFSAVSRASGPVFMFCAPGLVFGGTEGVGSRFHVLCARTRFRRYRGRRDPFSCFVRPHSFSAVPRASCRVFMFCAPGLVFGGTEGVGTRFHVLRARNRFRGNRGRQISFSCFALPDSFRRYRGSCVPFSCFMLPDSFSSLPSASGLVFMFCSPGIIFDGTEGVGSHFHFLRPRTHFRRYRGRRVPFSCFAGPDSFFGYSEGVQSHLLILRSQTRFGDTEGVGSRFQVLRSWTRFRRYLGRRFPFSRFAFPDTFSAVLGGSAPVFMFFALELVFDGTVGVGSRFYVLRP